MPQHGSMTQQYMGELEKLLALNNDPELCRTIATQAERKLCNATRGT